MNMAVSLWVPVQRGRYHTGSHCLGGGRGGAPLFFGIFLGYVVQRRGGMFATTPIGRKRHIMVMMMNIYYEFTAKKAKYDL